MSRVKTGIQLDVDQFIAPNADVLFKLTEGYVDKAFLGSKRWRGSDGARKNGVECNLVECNAIPLILNTATVQGGAP
jgi:hypothetical protein